MRGQRCVQLSRPGVVWVTIRKDARPAGAARTGRKVEVSEFQPLLRQAVNVGRADLGIPLATDVLGRDVVADDGNYVRGRAFCESPAVQENEKIRKRLMKVVAHRHSGQAFTKRFLENPTHTGPKLYLITH